MMPNVSDLIEELELMGDDELKSIVDGEERAAYRATRRYLEHLQGLNNPRAKLIARAVAAKCRISLFVDMRDLHKSHMLAREIMAGKTVSKPVELAVAA